MQAFRAGASRTARMYTCADARRDGVTRCLNCDGTNATAACVSHTGINGNGSNYTWVSDTVHIGGTALPGFEIAQSFIPEFGGIQVTIFRPHTP